ncbi:MAG: ribosome maturation factor RimM [Ideonella sp.]|nr:ribosome maturation factor RimM [Ideonella sp.]MCC7456594.1 ribosome maturation factor RimM [Nitrospira sp.]
MERDRAITEAGVTWPADAVEVGRIVDAFGVKGWIKLQPFAAEPQALFSSRRWHLQPPAHAAHTGPPLPPLLHITDCKSHGDTVVAAARELADRDAARALRGARVFVARGSFPTAGADEFYWVDLIGAEVVNREGEPLGTVTALIDTGVHSVLCVRRPDAAPDAPDTQAERLIPFVDAYVDAVDLEARRIRVDWGLHY